MQKRIREKSLVVVRDEALAEQLDNHFTLKEGDKILLRRELRDDFNLSKTNSIKVPVFSEVPRTHPDRRLLRADHALLPLDGAQGDRRLPHPQQAVQCFVAGRQRHEGEHPLHDEPPPPREQPGEERRLRAQVAARLREPTWCSASTRALRARWSWPRPRKPQPTYLRSSKKETSPRATWASVRASLKWVRRKATPTPERSRRRSSSHWRRRLELCERALHVLQRARAAARGAHVLPRRNGVLLVRVRREENRRPVPQVQEERVSRGESRQIEPWAAKT